MRYPLLISALLMLIASAPARGDALVDFLAGLKAPVTQDLDPARKRAPKGVLLVDEVVVYALRDSAGQRFCLSCHGRYCQRWLAERDRGLFVLLPHPVESYAWGGFSPARNSEAETQLAALLGGALGEPPNKFLSVTP